MRAALALVGALASLPCLASPADEVRALLEQGRDAEAWQLGRRHPQAWGDPAFDFYFGVAAINAGAAGEGVLALERYLLQFPQNRSALFQLARGYYMLGEDPRAREEFEALLPAATGSEREAIVQYLGAIRARESRYRPSARFHAEIGVGHDSNINSGIAAGQVAGLPEGFVVSPGQSAEKVADRFATVSVGWQGSWPVAPGVALYGGATAGGRWHADPRFDVFDSHTMGAQAGVTRISGRHVLRLGLEAARLQLDHQPYLDVATAGVEWQVQATAGHRFGLSAHAGQQDWHDVNAFLDLAKTVPTVSQTSIRDARLASVSGHWTLALDTARSPVFQVTLNAGRESNRRQRPDLSRHLWGARATASLQPAPQWTASLGIGWQQARHQAAFAEGIDARRDEVASLDAGLAYALGAHWSIRGELQHTRQTSNVGLYSFSRTAAALKLRYESR